MNPATRIPVFLVAVLLLGSCTEVDLLPVPTSSVLERQRLEASICAPAPAKENVPYRILFVIDTSLSNEWNDPAKNRERAVRNAITPYLAGGPQADQVKFGIITFSDDPRRQTYGFTRDKDILAGATENIGEAEGGTNYSDSLWTVIDFISDDINSLTPVQAARTRYRIFFESDGFPTVGVLNPDALLPGVTYLVEELGERVAEITLNTAFLGASGEPPAAQVQARDLLERMATTGQGDFMDIPAGAAFEFDLNPEPVLVSFKLLSAVVTNRHALFDPQGPRPDSDGDGLADADEIDTALELSDSDGDGYRDGVETRHADILNPLVYDPGCTTGDADTDLDGLWDCEEQLLGTDKTLADSDFDLIPDDLEIHMGTLPMSPKADLDTDQDGFADNAEVWQHLDPRVPTAVGDADIWSYRYSVDTVAATETGGPPCYEIVASNLAMAETQAVDDHAAGANLISVTVTFGPDGGGNTYRTYRGQALGYFFSAEDYVEPATGVFELDPEHFMAIGTP